MSEGHRTKAIWIAITIDEDNDESMVCWPGAPSPFEPARISPMIAFDEERLRTIREVLPKVARALRRPIHLVKFSVREDLETFGAKTASS